MNPEREADEASSSGDEEEEGLIIMDRTGGNQLLDDDDDDYTDDNNDDDDDDVEEDNEVSMIENRLRSRAHNMTVDANAAIEEFRSSSSVVRDETSSSGQGQSLQSVGPFLDDDEKWGLAKIIFPGVLKKNRRYDVSYIPNRSVEDAIWEILDFKNRELWVKNPELREELDKSERAVDLCIELGIDGTIASKRFEVVENLRRNIRHELGVNIQCMTPTISQIRHLVYTFGVRSSYGKSEHIHDGKDGRSVCAVRDKYNGKDWQSYFGIQLSSGKTKNAVQVIMNTVQHHHLDNCFVHGTNAKALQGINADDGVLIESKSDRRPSRPRHDFGSGVYTMKGEFVKALAWGIDSVWPLFNVQRQLFHRPKEHFPSEHNLAIIIFPKNIPEEKIYDVHSRQPFTDQELKKVFDKRDSPILAEFQAKRREYTDDKNWQSFVKLARYHDLVPSLQCSSQIAFKGRLHNVKTVTNTDTCGVPKMDPDMDWTQYCFPNSCTLGKKMVFVEFVVNWNEWLDKASKDCSTQWLGGSASSSDSDSSSDKNLVEDAAAPHQYS